MNSAFNLDGQVALVTGAGAGIGRAIAIALADAGADVAVTEVPTRLAAAEETASSVRAMGRRATVIALDQTVLEQIAQAIKSTVSALGRLDILINNAAVGVVKPAIEYTEDDWDYVVDTDLKGTFFCAQEAARQMIRQGSGGHIVNVASTLGFGAYFDRVAYCAAKAGVVNATRVLAVEWAKYGITVNGVAPGYIGTKMLLEWFEKNPAFAKDVTARIPVGHVGTPEDIANAVVYLASPAARYVVGHTLLVDGGWTSW